MTDEELRSTDRNELSDLAQECFDEVLASRKLGTLAKRLGPLPTPGDPAPYWLPDAVEVCSFQVGRGQRYAENAKNVCNILHEAGIPTYVRQSLEEPDEPQHLTVFVPDYLSLNANAVLDVEVFNEELERQYTAHFAQLSDLQLRDTKVDDLCAGFLDRARRLRRTYENALTERGLAK